MEFPFIYIYHGKPLDIYSFNGEKYYTLCFKNPVSSDEVKKIEKLIPEPLSGTNLWSENMLMIYSYSEEDEIISYYMKKNKIGYDKELSNKLLKEIFTDYANDIESWVLNSDKISPVYFFVGNSRINGSKWDKYSDTKINEVTDYIKENSINLTPRKKQIFNETLSQIKQGKSHILDKKIQAKIKELIKLTE